MIDFDFDDIDRAECESEAKAQKLYKARLLRHPGCDDPDHPGCKNCNDDHEDYDED